MLDPDHTFDAASLVEAITVSAGDRVAIDADDDCHIDTGGLRPPLACPSQTLPRRSPQNNPPGSAGDNITDDHARLLTFLTTTSYRSPKHLPYHHTVTSSTTSGSRWITTAKKAH